MAQDQNQQSVLPSWNHNGGVQSQRKVRSVHGGHTQTFKAFHFLNAHPLNYQLSLIWEIVSGEITSVSEQATAS